MSDVLSAGGVVLPSPAKMTLNNEIIWDSDTGRTLDGTMVGDVVAEKKTLDLSWGYLRGEEFALLESHLVAGFFPVIVFPESDNEVLIECYRGTLTGEFAGFFGGERWYSSASVKIVEV